MPRHGRPREGGYDQGVLDQAAGPNHHIWHELRGDFAHHLARSRAQPAEIIAGAQLVHLGLAALQKDRPLLFHVVEARHVAVPPRTQQALSLREQRGVEWLYDWCHRALALLERR